MGIIPKTETPNINLPNIMSFCCTDYKFDGQTLLLVEKSNCDKFNAGSIYKFDGKS